MKTDLEVEVEVDLRPLGKVIIFVTDKQNLPIIYRYIIITTNPVIIIIIPNINTRTIMIGLLALPLPVIIAGVITSTVQRIMH